MTGSYFIVAGLSLVAMILLAGMTLMLIGGPLDQRWSNVLMRYHVLAQGVTLILVCLIGGLATFS